MPIIAPKPWRRQFFDHVACPDDVMIPLADTDAWTLCADHRWIYDKLAVALSQGLQAAPHGVMPPGYPVFSKPMMNLRSMGTGSRAIASQAEYEAAMAPGHFWCTLLTGAHVSSDAALVDGKARWWRHATGITRPGGTFDYWHVHSEAFPEIEDWCGAWAERTLGGYTGMINFETIGGRIIEAHLRFADQWPDLYGPGWVEALVALYASRRWTYDDTARTDGYSVVLFGPHGPRYRHPPAEAIAAAAALPGVLSVQIPFYEDRDPAHHPMPPGGFRLATINAVSLRAGMAAREMLRDKFT
ncbi:hypothetical protein [Rhodopila sp.]|jgi:hypothetical protein|uniref:hypothetical protein n=1 Tax=Rhodopila sp. TaxID=2480087 RepID=UPI002B51B5B9|nr:hypothetical protein [Rhodopila sp.]HVZ08145.1 hypothetical protein [Rhodopila sp.]